MLSGEFPDRTMTATQARWTRNGNTDAAVEPEGKNMQFHHPYNEDATEYVQTHADSESDSESDEDDEFTFLRRADSTLVQWRVAPDYGELDYVVVNREHDIANGFKYGSMPYGLTAWHNPLADADDGQDDDQILLQHKAQLRYDTSEGPTKVDLGEADNVVVNREHDIANGFKYGGYGLTAWHNPLADADDGQDDEDVL